MRLGGSCEVGDPDASRSFVVLGDSHANAWLPALDYFAQQHHYRLIGLTRDGCFLGVLTTGDVCSSHWKKWLRELSKDKPEFVVLAQRFDPLVPADQLSAGLREELNALDQRVPRTVVMEDLPWHPLINPTDCLLRPGATLGDCTLTFPADMNTLWAALGKIVESDPQVRYLHTRQWFCSSGKCPIVIGNMIAFRDTHHVTATYARYLAPAISRDLSELTKTAP
jgi:hypothetical protein